jgi:hypothetical protein
MQQQFHSSSMSIGMAMCEAVCASSMCNQRPHLIGSRDDAPHLLPPLVYKAIALYCVGADPITLIQNCCAPEDVNPTSGEKRGPKHTSVSFSAQTLRCKQYPEWLLVLNSLSTARLHAGCEFRPTALMQPVRKSAARRRVDFKHTPQSRPINDA